MVLRVVIIYIAIVVQILFRQLRGGTHVSLHEPYCVDRTNIIQIQLHLGQTQVGSLSKAAMYLQAQKEAFRSQESSLFSQRGRWPSEKSFRSFNAFELALLGSKNSAEPAILDVSCL